MSPPPPFSGPLTLAGEVGVSFDLTAAPSGSFKMADDLLEFTDWSGSLAVKGPNMTVLMTAVGTMAVSNGFEVTTVTEVELGAYSPPRLLVKASHPGGWAAFGERLDFTTPQFEAELRLGPINAVNFEGHIECEPVELFGIATLGGRGGSEGPVFGLTISKEEGVNASLSVYLEGEVCLIALQTLGGPEFCLGTTWSDTTTGFFVGTLDATSDFGAASELLPDIGDLYYLSIPTREGLGAVELPSGQSMQVPEGLALIAAIPPATRILGRILDSLDGSSVISDLPFLAMFDAASYGLSLALGRGANPNVELSLNMHAELDIAKLPLPSSAACDTVCQDAHHRLPTAGSLVLQGTTKRWGSGAASRVGANFAIVVQGIDTVFGVLFGAPQDRPDWLAAVTGFVGFLFPPSVTIGVVATTFETMTFPGMPQLRVPVQEGVAIVATVDISAGCARDSEGNVIDMLCGFIHENFPGLSLFFKMRVGLPPVSEHPSVSADVGLSALVFARDSTCTETPRGQALSSPALPKPLLLHAAALPSALLTD